VRTSTHHKDATLPGNVQRGLLRQDIVRWRSDSTGARHEGDLGAGPSGFESIQGCARGSYGLQRSTAFLRFTHARACGRASDLMESAPAMEGALDCRNSSSLTRRRAEAVLVPARGGSHIPSRAGATESVRGGIKPSSPTDKVGAFRERRSKRPRPRAHQGRAMLGSSGRNPRATCDPRRSWRLAVKRGSTRSCPPRGFGRMGTWKLASPVKAGGEGDSRIERSKGCSSRRSVADVGRTHLPQRGEAGRKAESAGAGYARRGGSTLTAGVDSRRVKGCGVIAGKRHSERAAACSDREIGGFDRQKASWFRHLPSP